MLASLPVLEHHISPTLLLTGDTHPFLFPLTSWNMLEPFTSPSFPNTVLQRGAKKRHFEDAKEKGGKGKKLWPSALSFTYPSPFSLSFVLLAVPPIFASLVGQLVKNLPAVWETWVLSLGWEDPLEKGKATHSSILAWRIPWGRKELDTTEWFAQFSSQSEQCFHFPHCAFLLFFFFCLIFAWQSRS